MTWDSQTPDGNIIAITVLTPSYVGAFTVEGGELLETTEQTDGVWDWDAAGICEPHRGGNPELQSALRAALRALTDEAAR